MSFGHSLEHEPMDTPGCFICSTATRIAVGEALGRPISTTEAYAVLAVLRSGSPAPPTPIAEGPAA